MFHTDLLAMAASVYINVKLHFTPGQEYLHAPEPLDAFAAQLETEPDAIPVLQEG